jgi:hypothetical protein
MKKISLLCLSLLLLGSCKKGFLAAKPDQTLLIPSTLSDFQALLDNNTLFNTTPALGEIASDDIYTTTAGYQSTTLAIARNSYLWADDIFAGASSGDWRIPFQQVFYANIVLDGLQNLPIADPAAYNNVKGEALFCRAYAYFSLAQVFAAPYVPAQSASLPGLPLHLTADVNLRPGRGTLQQTYDQVTADLLQAAALLPAGQSVLTRPGRTAALALLSKVYLTLQDYPRSKAYADSTLAARSTLLDYNTLSASSTRPLPPLLQGGNPEVLYLSSLVAYTFLRSTTACLIDTNLFASYAAADLRKTIFFTNKGKGVSYFKGSYGGTGLLSNNLFSGLALDEVYLDRAECSARLNDVTGAMADLNALLVKRYQQGTYVSRTAVSGADALQQVLTERRKELVFRGQRWADLRRLNQEPAFAVTLTRVIAGTTTTLAPGALKYTFPIPPDEISAGGISQNPR